MINLAGVEECDVTILEELEKAGIDIYNIKEPGRSEVPYTVYGGLGGTPLDKDGQGFMDRHGIMVKTMKDFVSFTFERAWYYWMVRGYVPLDIAVEMYENPNGRKDIRVAGHCACPHPVDWKVKHKVCGMNVVDHYHIDTQEALNYFVTTLKKHRLI